MHYELQMSYVYHTDWPDSHQNRGIKKLIIIRPNLNDLVSLGSELFCTLCEFGVKMLARNYGILSFFCARSRGIDWLAYRTNFLVVENGGRNNFSENCFYIVLIATEIISLSCNHCKKSLWKKIQFTLRSYHTWIAIYYKVREVNTAALGNCKYTSLLFLIISRFGRVNLPIVITISFCSLIEMLRRLGFLFVNR